MSVTSYPFTKAANVERLKLEIQSDAAITIALDHIEFTDPDQLTVFFKAALPTADETALNALVAAHVNTPLDKPTEQRDSEGALIIRPKITKTGRTYQSRYIRFTTSLADSGVSSDYDNADIPGEVTVRLYDKNGVDITSSPANDVLELCVRTEVDINFSFIYDIFRARIAIKEEISEECIAFCRMAPLVPEAYGGSKDMLHGLDVSYLSRKQWVMFDGGAPKEVNNTLIPAPHFRKRFWHKPGQQVKFQTEWQLFK